MKQKDEKKQHQPNYKEYLVSVDEIKDYLMDHYLLRRNRTTICCAATW